MKYAKTEAGQLALKERSPQLTSRQRSAMILIDGKKTLDQVLAATAGAINVRLGGEALRRRDTGQGEAIEDAHTGQGAD